MPDDPKVLELPTSLNIANTQVDAAQQALYDNTKDLPQWPWLDLQRLCGSPLPGQRTEKRQ